MSAQPTSGPSGPLFSSSLALRHESIDSRNATLPATYEKAKTAIAVCDSLDECQDWADKAAALASYARQANDDELVRTAQRIQLRAVRRCGELIKAIAPKETPGRPPINRADALPIYSRAQAASDAGLSEHQRKTALRVASIPEPEFELAIETERVTVTEMAERGTQKAPPPVDLIEDRDPADFKAATALRSYLIPLAQLVATISPRAVAQGSRPRELPIMLRHLSTLQPWLADLIAELEKEVSIAESKRTA